MSTYVPSTTQLAAWGLPTGPLAAAVEMVKSPHSGHWHTPACPEVARLRGEPVTERRRLVDVSPCARCHPDIGADAASYLRLLRRLAALEAVLDGLRPEWHVVVEAEVTFAALPTALPVTRSAPALLTRVAEVYAARHQAGREALARARADAPNPVLTLAEGHVVERFLADPEAYQVAVDLCAIATPHTFDAHLPGPDDLLTRVAWAWLHAGDTAVADTVTTAFTGVPLRSSALPRPALAVVGGRNDPQSAAQAELLAYVTARTGDWPQRLARLAAEVAAEDEPTLLIPPAWPPCGWRWRSIAHLAAYPVVARAVDVTGRVGAQVVVVAVPKLVAAHAVRLLGSHRVRTRPLPADEPHDLDSVAVHADALLRVVTVTSAQRTEAPDADVLAVRRRGPARRSAERPYWTPVADDGPALTLQSRQQLARLADRAFAVGVVLADDGRPGDDTERLDSRVVEVVVPGKGFAVTDDATALIVGELLLPVSRVAYVRLALR